MFDRSSGVWSWVFVVATSWLIGILIIYNGLLSSPHNWVAFHPPTNPLNNQCSRFFHCSVEPLISSSPTHHTKVSFDFTTVERQEEETDSPSFPETWSHLESPKPGCCTKNRGDFTHPQNGWCINHGKPNPMNKWMTWGVFPLFLETPTWRIREMISVFFCENYRLQSSINQTKINEWYTPEN